MATISQIKRDFDLGVVKTAKIQRMFDFVIVEFDYGDLRPLEPLDDARNKKPRHFKTIDAAVRAIEQVGFDVSFLRL